MRVLQVYLCAVTEGSPFVSLRSFSGSKTRKFCFSLLLSVFSQTVFAHVPTLHCEGKEDGRTCAACDNVVTGGQIIGNEFGCPAPTWDPSAITNVSLPSGGTGNLEFLWIYTTSDPTSPFASWTPIPNSNSPEYDPGPISVTTYFRRCARRAGCTDYVGETNVVTKEAICCDNVSGGGAVAASQNGCVAPFDPLILTNIALPSGGSNALEYQWAISLTGTPYTSGSPDWTFVAGATAAGYDPPAVSQNTYYVRLARRHGCTEYAGVSNLVAITISSSVSLAAAADPVTCFGGSDGSIDLTVSGGSGTFQFSWNLVQGNVEDPQNLQAGTYAVTVTDVGGCTATGSYSITQSVLLQATATSTPPNCLGANDGTATVTVSGGMAPYAYLWNDATLSTESTAQNLTSSAYTVTVTDANGCTSTAASLVNAGSALLPSFSTEATLCAGGNDGLATILDVTGGIGNYVYEWSTGQVGQTINGLEAGNYTVTVTDVQGCTGTGTAVVADGIPLILNASHTDASCNYLANGSASLQVSGGTAPYEYLWNDNGGQTGATASSLAAGVYLVTVSDANSCTATTSVTVEAPIGAEISMTATHVSCAGGNNGSATVTVENLDPGDFSYQWDNPGASNTSNISNLQAGFYTVTVADDNGCLVTGSVLVTQPTALALTLIAQAASCSDAGDGSVSVIVSGGTAFGDGSYDYAWNAPGAPDVPVVGGLASGTYTVIVTDANACTATGSVQVDAPEKVTPALTVSNVTCFGLGNGFVNNNVTGGVSPYTYIWNNGAATPGLTSLSPGTYSLTVTDATGCTGTATAVITQPAALGVSFQTNNVVCAEDTDGSALSLVQSGVQPYTYLWSNGQTTPTATGLAVGTYGLTVTDANSCQISGAAVINSTSNFTATISASPSNCFNSSDGSATVVVDFGVEPIQYAWNNGSTADTANGLSSGAYSVTVTDGNGCTLVQSVQVTAPPSLGCNAQVIAPVSTYGGSNGSASVNPSGGVGPYTSLWSNGQTTAVAGSLSAGTHLVTVTDAHGCTCSSNITLTNPSKVGNFVWNDADNDGVQDAGETGIGGVALKLSGATYTGIQVNQTTVSNSDGSYAFDGLSAGVYQVKVTLPSLHIFTLANVGSDETDSDINPMDSTSAVFAVSAAFFESRLDVGLVALDEKINIGDYVWRDVDHDGIQDNTETGYGGITVRLYKMPADSLVSTKVTDTAGKYLFTNIYPGSYQVEFVPGSLANGYTFSLKDQGTNDLLDSDADSNTGRTNTFQVLPFTPDNLTIDAGIFKECDNIVDGGVVGYDEALCGVGADPAEIVNVTFPTGGFGTIEYLWLKSTVPVFNGPGDPNWSPIPNSNNPNYNPGPINISTYYIRCARRQGCVNYPGESNSIAKTLTASPLTQITTAPGSLCINEGGAFEAAIAGGGATYAWNFGAAATPPTANTRTVTGVYWTAPGSYTVSLTVTRFGCSATVTTQVLVDNCQAPLIVVDDPEGHLANGQVALTWKVSGNTGDYTFFVQRSENGLNFTNLGAVAGKPGLGISEFIFTDAHPLPGDNHYRLHFKNETAAGYSGVMTVVNQPVYARLAMVYPNPTQSHVTVQLLEPADSSIKISLYNALGVLLEQQEIPAMTEKIPVDLLARSKGIYWMCIHKEGVKDEVIKVVKME